MLGLSPDKFDKLDLKNLIKKKTSPDYYNKLLYII